jgi:uncharacterized protein (TIGR00645 family)
MIERGLERILFASRWLLVPFYLGLVIALALLAVKFVQKLIGLFPVLLELELNGAIVASLKLVDLALTGNLLLMVILAGYENFVSRIRSAAADERPAWMGHTDFAELKIKLITSIVAISAIQVLEGFMDITNTSKTDLAWQVGILIAFVVSGLLLAVMDRIGGQTGPRG